MIALIGDSDGGDPVVKERPVVASRLSARVRRTPGFGVEPAG